MTAITLLFFIGWLISLYIGFVWGAYQAFFKGINTGYERGASMCAKYGHVEALEMKRQYDELRKSGKLEAHLKQWREQREKAQ